MDFSIARITERFNKFIEYLVNNRKQFFIGIGGIIVLTLGMIGYSYYREWSEASAHKAFIEMMRYYDAPVTGKMVATESVIEFASEAEKWAKVAEVCKTTYNQHRGSDMASMFQAYQAQALASQGNIDEAIALLSSAVNSIPSKEMRDFYSLKLTLMKLDSSKPDVQQAGFAELKKMAENTAAITHEAALYYLGSYFWNLKDFNQAKNYWQQLMVKYGLKEAKQQSGFGELIKSRLKLISPEW